MQTKIRFAASQVSLWLRTARAARTVAEQRLAIQEARSWASELSALRATGGAS